MPLLAPPDYPKSLTETDWKNKKGVFAKMAGETGIGAQLKKIKAAFDEVDWPKFYGKALCTKDKGVVTPSQAKACKDAMIKAYKAKVPKVREEIKAFDTLAEKVIAKFKDSKTIPKSSREHIEAMVKTGEFFTVALKDTGVYVTASIKEFDDEIARLERLQTIAKKAIEEGMKNVLQNAVDVKKTPDVATFTGGSGTGFYQSIRTVNAALAQLKDIKAFDKFRKDTWVDFSQAEFLPKEDKEVLPKVKAVLAATKTLGGLVTANL